MKENLSRIYIMLRIYWNITMYVTYACVRVRVRVNCTLTEETLLKTYVFCYSDSLTHKNATYIRAEDNLPTKCTCQKTLTKWGRCLETYPHLNIFGNFKVTNRNVPNEYIYDYYTSFIDFLINGMDEEPVWLSN